MDVHFAQPAMREIDRLKCDAIGIPFFSDEHPPRGVLGLLDWRLCGLVTRMMMRDKIAGAPLETVLIPARQRLSVDKLLLFGAGPRSQFSAERINELMRHMLATLTQLGARSSAIVLPGRSPALVEPAVAIETLLTTSTSFPDHDEVWVLDSLDAQRLMTPVVDRERRRARAFV